MTAPASATEFSVFLPFAKVDKQSDGTVMVHTLLNDETLDDQGEIVDFSAVEKASADYMAWANVRSMHGDQETAAGTMVSLTPDPAARTHEAILHVVDPVDVQKVLTKVYKGTSLGGFKRRIRLQKSATGETVKRIMEIDWRETSLVDRPSRPTARLTLLKRSDGGDPPPLIEEDLMADDELAKVSEAPTTAPAAEIQPETGAEPAGAPEAGTDVYLGPDGQPLAKAAESEPAPDVPRGTPEALAKSATDDVWNAHWIIECIDRLIQGEGAESGQLAQLKGARALMVAFESGEVAEIGTPEEAAEDQAKMAQIVANDAAGPKALGDVATQADMAYAAEGGALRETIATVVEEVLAKRAASPEPPPAPEPAPEPASTEPESSSQELLRKTTSYMDEQFARYVSRPELEAMKGEVLGALTPMSEALAKIARFPAPGGPVRFAADGDRFAGESEGGPTTEAEVLAKASRATSDPHLREELGRLAAAAQIRADRTAR